MPAEIIKFLCPACQKKISAPRDHAGMKGHCPTCKAAVEIPKESTPAQNGTAGSDLRPAVVMAPEENGQGGDAKSKPDFIKFNCPGCGKPIGFPGKLAQQTETCPACYVRVMVPAVPGEESFIVGGAPEQKPAPAEKPVEKPEPTTKTASTGKTRPQEKVASKPHPKQAASSRKLAGAKPTRTISSLHIFLVLVSVLLAAGAVWVIIHTQKNSPPKPDGRVAAANNAELAPSKPDETPGTRVSGPTTDTAKNPGSKTDETPGTKASGAPADTEKTAAATETKTEGTISPAGQNQPQDLDFAVVAREKKEAPLPVMDDTEESPKPAIAKTPTLKLPGGPADTKQPEARQPENQAPPQAAPPALPVINVCQRCLGTGFVPIVPARPVYAWLHTMATPDPAAAVPWSYCPKCNAGKDQKELVQAESDRLATADAKRQKWEELTGLHFQDVETRHITLHATLSQGMARNIGLYCDKLATHLEKITNTTVLTQTRPDTHEILILWDKASYSKFIDIMEQNSPNDSWPLARKTTGAQSRYRSFFNANEGRLVPPEHMALFQLAKMLIEEATDGKAQPWLTEGFAAYCENAVTQKNLCYSFAYEENNVHFGFNWDADIKKYARQSKLKTWDIMFLQDLIGLKALDYLTCYSMVSFLIKTDPQRFALYVASLREGIANAPAMERAYGRTVKDLQTMWGQWTLK